MAKAVNKETFELIKLDPNNIAELNQWEMKLKKLVKENQFLEVVDSATFKEAKKRRTNLKSGRTEVQKQDGVIASFMQSFRKQIKSKTDWLAEIVSPHEDKQQIEIDRYQKILDDAKDEADRIEAERTNGIRTMIDGTEKQLQSIIDHVVFENVEVAKSDFKQFVDNLPKGFDLQELRFLFEEMVFKMDEKLRDKIEQIEQDESTRISRLDESRRSKVNQMIVDGQEVLDGIDGSVEIKLINQMMSGIFQTMIDCDVEFNDEWNAKVGEEKQKMLVKVQEKLDWIDKNKVSDEKDRIIDVREGLLDIIFQMTESDATEKTNYIMEALDQTVMDENKLLFERATIKVSAELKTKLESIISEGKEKQEKAKKINDQRISDLEKMGFVSTDKNLWSGFGVEVMRLTIESFDENGFELFMEEITWIKEKNIQELERQERIRPDKVIVMNEFVRIKELLNSFSPEAVKDEKTLEYFWKLRQEMIELCETNMDLINKF